MANLVRIVIQLPEDLKRQLDALKQQGYTASGFIRAMLERELSKHAPAQPPVLQVVPPKKRAARA